MEVLEEQATAGRWHRQMTEYLDALGATVDIWEVGNEINGEWLGTTSDVVAKASIAFDLVRKRGYRTGDLGEIDGEIAMEDDEFNSVWPSG